MFLGGSDLGIAKNSPNQAQALAWIKLYTGTANQLNQATNEGFIPNASNLVGQVSVSSQHLDLLQGRGREPVHATGARLGDGRGRQRHAGPVRPGSRRQAERRPDRQGSTTKSSTPCSTPNRQLRRNGCADSARFGARQDGAHRLVGARPTVGAPSSRAGAALCGASSCPSFSSSRRSASSAS